MEQKNIPLVSIGMPTYNGESFIREALDSLLAQDFRDFELIISDNASTDNTSKICREYAKRDSRVRYYRNKENMGSNANFNNALRLARGKYFMWAADDDVWEPNFISCMIDALGHNAKAVLSFSGYDAIDLSGKQTAVSDQDPLAEVCGRELFSRLLPRCHAKLWGANMAIYIYGLIRKDVLVKCGGMEQKVDVYKGSDLVTLFHLLSYGTFIKVDKTLHHRRDNTPRLTAKARVSREPRKAHLSLSVSSILAWQQGLHQHYGALRKIVMHCTLGAQQKFALIAVLYAAELRHYSRSILIRLVPPVRNIWK